MARKVKDKKKEALQKLTSELSYQYANANIQRLIHIHNFQLNYIKQLGASINNIHRASEISCIDNLANFKNILLMGKILQVLGISNEEFNSMIDDEKKQKLDQLIALVEENANRLSEAQAECEKIKGEMAECINALNQEFADSEKSKE